MNINDGDNYFLFIILSEKIRKRMLKIYSDSIEILRKLIEFR